MNLTSRLFALLFILNITSNAKATVDDDQLITMLGADLKDHKVYFIRDYHPQFGYIPALYYFDLKSKAPSNLIEVKSIYKKIDDKNFENSLTKLNKEIDKIKSRLVSLKQINKSIASVETTKPSEVKGQFWLNADDLIITKYSQEYIVKNPPSHRSKVEKNISYETPEINIINIFSTPKELGNYQIGIVRYLGVPTEFGYRKDDAVLLAPQ